MVLLLSVAADPRRWQESNPPDGDHPSHSF
jgi:hypothetical protein